MYNVALSHVHASIAAVEEQ